MARRGISTIAGWTFVLWGLMRGLGLIGYHMFGKLDMTLPRTLSWLLIFVFVVFGCVLFRSLDFSMARSKANQAPQMHHVIFVKLV